MKITDVKVELFNWKSEPWGTGVDSGVTFKARAMSQLGIVTVSTDEGINGHAFLGNSRMGADHFVKGLIQFIKPIIMQNRRQ